MSTNSHLTVLRSKLQADISRKQQEIEEMRRKLGSVEDVLSMLEGERPTPKPAPSQSIPGKYAGLGATKAILRCVLDGPNGRNWSAADVRDELLANGFVTKAQQPYSLILNNLVRHVEYGNLEAVEIDGIRRFRKPTQPRQLEHSHNEDEMMLS